MTRALLTVAAFLMAFVAVSYAGDDDDVEAGTVGTGIMGVITGLGSINVNGLNIAVPDTLFVQSALGDRPASTLEVGESVVVEARITSETLTAKSIRNYYPIVAPIEQIDQNTMTLMGLSIDISSANSSGLAEGDWVAVSGLWRGDTVIVSNIRSVAPREEAVVNGTFSETADGIQMVGSIALDRRYIAHAEIGDHLRIIGNWSPVTQTFTPTRIRAGLFSPNLQTLLIEGYMAKPDRRGAYSIYGSGIVAYTDDPNMNVPPERSLYCIDRTGPVQITQTLELDMSQEQRLQFLENRSQSQSPGSARRSICNAK